MRKYNEQNERIKREYLTFLREAKGQDETSLDKVSAALLDFEQAISFKSFKAFNRDWSTRYKKHLRARKNARTGRPLGVSTRDATLRLVKRFIEWLSTQPGYKAKISYSDAAYFNNNAKEARAAHAQRHIPYPSLEQCAYAFQHMPEASEIEKRNKAVFACLLLTGARDGAVASFQLGHVDLVEGKLFQDGRAVKTKNSKTFDSWFFPVNAMYRETLEGWVDYLRLEKLYGPTDALFPKVEIAAGKGRFGAGGLSRSPYVNGQKINQIFKGAFLSSGLPSFNAHTIRKTLAMEMDRICTTMEQRKAWSQNLGHEQLATTVTSYMPVSRERQREIFNAMGRLRDTS